MIPKVIYQTWKTQKLDKKIHKLHSKMLKVNAEYSHIIYTDDQMFDYVKANYDKEIFTYFERINNIVSRADFWRYLILYKDGGVYVDIDSMIVRDLDGLIEKNDEGVVTAEKNYNCYVQWALIFNKNHPILEKTINNLIANIDNDRYKNDLLNFSVKPYWDAINETITTESLDITWDDISDKTNRLFNLKDSNVRFYGVDYGDYIIFKHKYNHLLRGKNAGDYTKDHWTLTQKQFDVYT